MIGLFTDIKYQEPNLLLMAQAKYQERGNA
jgi:hypothetical protein